LECGLRLPGDTLVAFADGEAAFFALGRLARPGRSLDLVSAAVLAKWNWSVRSRPKHGDVGPHDSTILWEANNRSRILQLGWKIDLRPIFGGAIVTGCVSEPKLPEPLNFMKARKHNVTS
jgi:hypothetical protein